MRLFILISTISSLFAFPHRYYDEVIPAEILAQASPVAEEPVPNVPVDKTIDIDANGVLSLQEVQYAAFVHHGLSGSVVQGMFNEVDTNHDGVLDAVEFNEIRAMVLAKAENAALRYMQSVDTDKNEMLSLQEAQAYMLKEYGIGARDVERVWLLVVPDTRVQMNSVQFSKLRRRIRGLTIRLARQILKNADTNGDGHINLEEAQAIAFEQEGIGAGDVAQMLASVDDNGDGELNAPEFADFERIVRARAVETSRKALKVVDTDNSNSLTMDEAKSIAFDHYGFDEQVLIPFFDQADENEDGQLDYVEFAGFRSVIRAKAVKNAVIVMKEIDLDGDSLINLDEAQRKTRKEDDMEPKETLTLFNLADQNKSGKLDKVELADFIRLVRLSAIRFAEDHYQEFDANHDRAVTVEELGALIEAKYHVPLDITKKFFDTVDVDGSGDLIPAEIVDFRHEIRKYVAEHSPPQSSAERDIEEYSDALANEEVTEGTVSVVNAKKSQKNKSTEITTTVSPKKQSHEKSNEELTTTISTTTTIAPTPSTTTPLVKRVREEQEEEHFLGPKEVVTRVTQKTTTVKKTTTPPPTLIPKMPDFEEALQPQDKVEITDEKEMAAEEVRASPSSKFNHRVLSSKTLSGDVLTDTSIDEPVEKNQSWRPEQGAPETQTTTAEAMTRRTKLITKPPITTTPETIEYEVVEVEVDEHGNEMPATTKESKKSASLEAPPRAVKPPVSQKSNDSKSTKPNSDEYEEVVEYVEEEEEKPKKER